MKLDEINIKLPRKSKSLENILKSCKERKKFVKDPPENYKKRLKKSKHDLARAKDEFKEKCWDWTIIKTYYAIFHAGNTLLSKRKGLFSKDHSCLIVALKNWDLIDEELFKELRNIYENFSDTVSMDLTFQLKKISQYNVELWEELTKEDAETVLKIAEKLVNYVEGEVYD